MLNRLLIQRRRVAIAMLFTLLASLVLWPSVLGAGLTALAGVCVTVIIIMIAPARRRWIESGAIGLFVTSWVPPELMAPIFVAVTGAIYAVLYGRALDRTGLRFDASGTLVSEIAAPLEGVWAAIIPGEAEPSHYWSGDLVDYSRDPDDPNLIYMRMRRDDGLYEDATAEFIERDAPALAYYAEERGESDDGDMWLIRHRLSAEGANKTRIESRLLAEDQPFRVALGHWFDDPFRNHFAGFARVVSVNQSWSIARRDAPRTEVPA